MVYGLNQSTPPTAEPVSAAEIKTQLRLTYVENATEDAYLATCVKAARQNIERYTRRQLITATWKAYLDGSFPDEILLPFPPMQSVTSIQYVDSDGDTQTVDSTTYSVDIYSTVPRIIPAFQDTWPTTRDHIQTITVTWVAGYGDAGSDCPADIVHAVKLQAGDYYNNRESTGEKRVHLLPAIKSLLYPFRIFDNL